MQVFNSRIIIIAALLSVLSAGTALANPSVDLGSVSGSPCASVIIPITLTNDGLAQVAATSNDIGYNNTYLTPVNASIGPAGQAAGKNIIKNIVRPGLYRVGVMSTADLGPISSGIVAYVTFEINCSAPAGAYQLSNTPKTSSPNAISLATDGRGGSIAVSLITTTTTSVVQEPTEHIESCVSCHGAVFHSVTAHTNDCAQCHDGPPQKGNVTPGRCAVCHPLTNAGACNLTTLHDPGKGVNCLNCHIDCKGDADTHISRCLTCHSLGSLHGLTAHNTCSKCHAGSPQKGNVQADKCAACHPAGNTGKCKLVDFHEPARGGGCLNCHMNCSGGGPLTTSVATTAPSSTTSSNPGGITSTSTSSPQGSSTSTTSVPPAGHTGMCLSCHFVADLHRYASHSTCSKCHNGGPAAGNVDANSCTACHPLSSPGKANLITTHSGNCVTCHAPAGTSTPTTGPTTSIPGSGATTTVPGGHTGMCLSCHSAGDLHSGTGHTDCAKCHSGTPGTGNVDANSCTACHPLSSPGKANLINTHSGNCVTCHAPAGTSTPTTRPTTSITSSGSTTTTTLPGGHTGMCLSCHFVVDLHSRPGHTDCAKCHSGTPAKGNVEAANCAACHPLNKPGKTDLITNHIGNCTTCHAAPPASTTTTSVAGQSTTTSTFNEHVKQCVSCHTVSDIHARPGHGTCSACHSGAPGKGTVSPINCTQCHPLGSAGKCSLIETHGTTCLQCHSNCSEGTTTSTAAATTTTTTTPPSTTTTTITPIVCPLKNILGEQNQAGLNIFRAFRDQRLSASPEGLAVIYLYYKHGRETGEILRSNQALLSRAASLIQEVRPQLARSMNAGDTVTITVRQYQEAVDLLKALQQQASPRLRQSISFVLRLIDNSEFLRQLRIELQKRPLIK